MPPRGQEGASSEGRPPHGTGKPSPAGSRRMAPPNGGARAPDHGPKARGPGTATGRQRSRPCAAHGTAGARRAGQASAWQRGDRRVQHLRPRRLRAARDGALPPGRALPRRRWRRRAHSGARVRRWARGAAHAPGPRCTPSGGWIGPRTTAPDRWACPPASRAGSTPWGNTPWTQAGTRGSRRAAPGFALVGVVPRRARAGCAGHGRPPHGQGGRCRP